MAGKQKVVPLDTYNNEMEARMVAQILEENGIGAVVQPMGSGYGGLGVTQFIPHRVFVVEDSLEQAQGIVDAIQSNAVEDFPETTAP